MASTFGDIKVCYETRLCEVGDRVGYFHCWEQYADVIAPGLTIGSHPGGQFARVYGIVEFVDGVERVDPPRIKFIDEDHDILDKFCAVGNVYAVSAQEIERGLSNDDFRDYSGLLD